MVGILNPFVYVSLKGKADNKDEQQFAGKEHFAFISRGLKAMKPLNVNHSAITKNATYLTKKNLSLGKALQIWKVTTNVSNKQPRISDKGWSSTSQISYRLILHYQKNHYVTTCFTLYELQRFWASNVQLKKVYSEKSREKRPFQRLGVDL